MLLNVIYIILKYTLYVIHPSYKYATNCCLHKQWNVNEILSTTC